MGFLKLTIAGWKASVVGPGGTFPDAAPGWPAPTEAAAGWLSLAQCRVGLEPRSHPWLGNPPYLPSP